jgi:hypothetical protein
MKNKKIRCRNCGNYFYPDKFNRHHQRYCSRLECKKASRFASAQRYRNKKSRDKKFRRGESERVKCWQRNNPNYWKNRRKSSKKAEKNKVLRDIARVEKLHSDVGVLRDIANLQNIVMEGLIVTLTGDVLRDDIGAFIRQMYDKGQDVSGKAPEGSFIMQLLTERTNNDQQKVNRFSSQTSDTDTFQLGGSQSCT